MNKKTVLLLMILLLMLSLCLLAGCGKTEQPSAAAESGETVTVTDHNGNEIEVPRQIESIVVCDSYPLPSVLAVFFDSADKLVGIPEQSMKAAANGLLSELYPEILNAATDYINGTEVNIEELLALEPDVVFYSAGSPQIGEQLAAVGVPALAISASQQNFDAIATLNSWIGLLSQLFPENDRSELVRQYSEAVYQRVQERVAGLSDEQRQRVFFLFQYGDSTLTTSGRKFFGQYWADAVGAVNVGAEMDTVNSTPVTMEQVYAWDPQCIFITNFNSAVPDDLYNNAIGNYDWSSVSAVSEQRVFKMPLGMYRSYTCGVDTPVTLLWLAQQTYPELFSDIDIVAEAQQYYSEVFGIELSGQQAASIFAPSADAAAF